MELKAEATITDVRTEAERGFRVIYVSWKNTGNLTIRTLKATIHTVDEDGSPTGKVVENYPIYAAPFDSPGVDPGEEFTKHTGHRLTTDAKLRVEITSVSTDGW